MVESHPPSIPHLQLAVVTSQKNTPRQKEGIFEKICESSYVLYQSGFIILKMANIVLQELAVSSKLMQRHWCLDSSMGRTLLRPENSVMLIHFWK